MFVDYGVYISSRPGKTATTDYGPQYLSVTVTNPSAGQIILTATAPGSPNERFIFVKQLKLKANAAATFRIKTKKADTSIIENFITPVYANEETNIDLFCPLRVPSGGSFEISVDEDVTGDVFVFVHGWYETFINDPVNG